MDDKNHQPCKYTVSCNKLIPDLNLAEGRNFTTDWEPKTQTFSSIKSNGFTELKKAQ